MSVPPDIEIARAATLQPIGAVAECLGIPAEALLSDPMQAPSKP